PPPPAQAGRGKEGCCRTRGLRRRCAAAALPEGSLSPARLRPPGESRRLPLPERAGTLREEAASRRRRRSAQAARAKLGPCAIWHGPPQSPSNDLPENDFPDATRHSDPLGTSRR